MFCDLGMEALRQVEGIRECRAKLHLPGYVVSTGGLSDGFGQPLCVYYERRHPREFCELISGCFKCGFKEHLLRDYSNRIKVSQTQSSAPALVPDGGRGQGRCGNERKVG
ncbi:hypothetical protein PVK06_007424 [Gossypium arboreum]|uniref:Uncharacterized protein n=1 Tax=Gossypium arboreum TaxID=29729 RepID=A0ABR0QHA1_GOSAR|nr:hypothetical protein PVK06_007424 [Gossypium arboreum]